MKPTDNQRGTLGADAVDVGKVFVVVCGRSCFHKVAERIGTQQSFGYVCTTFWNAQGDEQSLCIHFTSLLDGLHDVRCRAFAKAFQRGNLANVVGQTVDVSEVADPAEVDEACKCLFGDSVDVHSCLRHEAGVLFQLLGRAGGIGTVQRASATLLAYYNLCGLMAHGTRFRDMKCADGFDDFNHFRDDFVGLDDRKLCALVANTQPFALADVAERCSFHGGTFQFNGTEDGYGRNR